MTKRIYKNCLGRVFHYLKEHKKASMKELVLNSECSQRTIQNVVLELIDKDVIGKYRSLSDARVSIYFFKKKVTELSHLNILQEKAKKDLYSEVTKLNLLFPNRKFKVINHGKQIGVYCVIDTKRNLLFLARDYIQANQKMIDMIIILTGVFGGK